MQYNQTADDLGSHFQLIWVTVLMDFDQILLHMISILVVLMVLVVLFTLGGLAGKSSKSSKA